MRKGWGKGEENKKIANKCEESMTEEDPRKNDVTVKSVRVYSKL